VAPLRGRSSQLVDDVMAGLVHDEEEVVETYSDPRLDPWDTLVLPVIRMMPRAEVAAAVGVHERKVAEWRQEQARPTKKHQRAATEAAGDWARSRLQAAAVRTPRADLAACRGATTPRSIQPLIPDVARITSSRFRDSSAAHYGSAAQVPAPRSSHRAPRWDCRAGDLRART
jgi:hypothetical protein